MNDAAGGRAYGLDPELFKFSNPKEQRDAERDFEELKQKMSKYEA